MNNKVAWIIGGAALLLYVMYRSKQQQTRSIIAGNNAALRTGTPVNRPGVYGSGGVDTLFNTLGSLLKGITNNTQNGKSSGGTGSSGASGGMSQPSKATGPGSQTGNLFNAGGMPANLNLGSYVGLDGQLYNIDGQALDANGNPIPGVYDNSGSGPAGAGINADTTIATNPLEYGDPNDPTSALYGVVAPLNTGGITVPTLPEGGSGAVAAALASAADDSATQAGTLPASPLGSGFVAPPPDGSFALVTDPSYPPADTGATSDATANAGPADSSLTSTYMTGDTFSNGPSNADNSAPDAVTVDTGGDIGDSWNDYNVDYGY